MFRRFYWLCVGMGVGFGGSFWVRRVARETAARYSPERVSADLTASVKGIGSDIRGAVADGRVAMREREAELRADAVRTRT